MTFCKDIFLELLKAGLWNASPDLSLFEKGTVDWKEVLLLCEEQTVTGIVTSALDKVPQQYLNPSDRARFYALTMGLQDNNKRLNGFVPYLMAQLERKKVSSILLKGQGVALCYREPLLRVSGDVDLLITDYQQYQKARRLMSKISEELGDEDEGRKHSAYKYKGMVVELHGDFKFSVSKKCWDNTYLWKDKRLNGSFRVVEDVRLKGAVLPPVQFDVVFIFAHLLNHFMGAGGVGLRQVADWMMFVDRYFEDIDMKVLEDDLDLLGLRKYWEVFGEMAVGCLDFPRERMPLFAPNHLSNGRKVLDNIFQTGNFGTKQREAQLGKGANVMVKRMVTLFGQLPVYARNFRIFPKDSLWCFREYVMKALHGNKTKTLPGELARAAQAQSAPPGDSAGQ